MYASEKHTYCTLRSKTYWAPLTSWKLIENGLQAVENLLRSFCNKILILSYIYADSAENLKLNMPEKNLKGNSSINVSNGAKIIHLQKLFTRKDKQHKDTYIKNLWKFIEILL